MRLPLVRASLLVAGALFASATLATAQLHFDAGPRPGQLYPRWADDHGRVELRGAVDSPGWSRIHFEVTRDGAPWELYSQDLNYSTGSAPFAWTSRIETGLVEYRFRVFLEGFGGITQVREVDNVVCGDAFLIQGQSNAVAADSHNQNLANMHQRHWLRCYGTGSLRGQDTRRDDTWYVADGIRGSGPGTIGGWGIRMGQLLVDELQIPVAILNGAIGATSISWHQRNDADPTDLSSNYGRLLFRAQRAGLDQHVRALFWYQGEADGGMDPLQYLAHFRALHDDWLQDFPSLEQIYLFQIHTGCGTTDMGIREVQRRIGDRFADVSLMSTTHTTGHDGCHYWYSGYRQLGERIARLVGRDLYGFAAAPGATPPNVLEARFTSTARDHIEVQFRNPAQRLVVDPGAEADFVLDTGERVIGVQVAGDRLLLQLDRPSNATTLAWTGHSFDGPSIHNALGVGILTFEIPVH